MAERSGMLLELLEQHENLEPNEAGTYFAVNTLNLALAKIGETISGAKRLRAGYKHKNRHAKFQLENKVTGKKKKHSTDPATRTTWPSSF